VTRPQSDLIRAGVDALVRGSRRRIEHVSGTAARPIVRLEGCSSRSDVEALRGADLLVPAPPLEPGEYWAADLEGCLVVDGDRLLGTVTRMVALPSCEALEVGDRLIPMVRDAIRSVDLEARRIDVDSEFLGE
jgi:16S rRNA processing protein RimM